jgi:hypothetical protein
MFGPPNFSFESNFASQNGRQVENDACQHLNEETQEPK